MCGCMGKKKKHWREQERTKVRGWSGHYILAASVSRQLRTVSQVDFTVSALWPQRIVITLTIGQLIPFSHFYSPLHLYFVRVRVGRIVTWFRPPDDFSVKMMGNSATSRWVYLTVGLIVMAELVTVSGRGHIDYPSSFGPKERRKRQGRMSFFFTSASLLKSWNSVKCYIGKRITELFSSCKYSLWDGERSRERILRQGEDESAHSLNLGDKECMAQRTK